MRNLSIIVLLVLSFLEMINFGSFYILLLTMGILCLFAASGSE